MVTIAFKAPTVSPESDKEYYAFSIHRQLIEEAMPCYMAHVCRWVDEYLQDSAAQTVERIGRVRGVLGSRCHPRVVAGYAGIAFFLQKVGAQ